MSGGAYNRNSPGAMSVPPFPSVKKSHFQNSTQEKTTRSGVALSVIVRNVLERMFGEGVSIEALILSGNLVNGSVKRKTAEVCLNDFGNSDLVFIGNMILVGGNECIYINACSAFRVMFVTHTASSL